MYMEKCAYVYGSGAVDRKATTKSFNFATKRNLDFYYVSAADGTNVVKVCSLPDHICSCIVAMLVAACFMSYCATPLVGIQ